jgi:hypothetical protein
MNPRARSRSGAVAALLLVAALYALPAAANLTLTVVDPDRTGPPDTTYVFAGTITNGFATPRNASDLFFDFSGFDPAVLSPAQLFGLVDFVIPAGGTTALMDLFEVHVGAAAFGATYFADVTVQDVFGHFSPPLTISITLLPEPSTAWLVLVAFAALAGAMRSRRLR